MAQLPSDVSSNERIDHEIARIDEGIQWLVKMRGQDTNSIVSKLHFFADMIQGYVLLHEEFGWTKEDHPGKLEEYKPATLPLGLLSQKYQRRYSSPGENYTDALGKLNERVRREHQGRSMYQ